jgi:hypothetical protein
MKLVTDLLRVSVLGVALSASLPFAMLPTAAVAQDTCARVSTFDVASRSQNLFAAVLIAIDGQLPGPVNADSWRIQPGKHTLKVAEAIDANRFSPPQNRERDGRQHDRYKTLTIEAEAGLTYRLAARFYPDKRNDMRGGGYWEPEIWSTKAEACK